MTPRSFLLTPQLADYVLACSEPPDDVVTDLIAETAERAERGELSGTMQIAAQQGPFMQLLTAALGVRNAIEIGTFTGFSALSIARGMPADGSLLCLDVDPVTTTIARRYWERAGVADRIELRVGDARETLRALPEAETYDLAFVDADKSSYPLYVAQLHPRMRPNGVVLLDNTLRRGRVLAPENPDDEALAALNAALVDDPRWDTVLLPLFDGLTMLRKR